MEYKIYDLELVQCFLMNYRRNLLDIRDLMLEYTIFHDIMGSGTELELLMVDSNGTIELTPIVGDETILLSFRTPSLQKLRTYVFRVYKIENRSKETVRSDVYILRAASQELISNENTSFSATYSGLPATSIVRSIYDRYLKATPTDHMHVRKKNLYLQETSGTHHFLFSRASPLQKINQICAEAETAASGLVRCYNDTGHLVETTPFSDGSRASNFVFYESYDGWYFRTLDSLLAMPPVEDFYLVDALLEEGRNTGEDTIRDYQKITSITFEKQLDTRENMHNGLYAHRVDTIDPILKKYTEDTFQYGRDYQKISHLELNLPYSHESIFGRPHEARSKNYIVSNLGENYTNKSYLAGALANDPQLQNPRRLHRFMKYDVVSRLQLNNIVVTVGIPGNTDIEIGAVVNLHIPQSSEIDEYMTRLNLLHGKKFFVTAVRHTYNKKDNTFFTVLECVKDTYAKKVLEESRELVMEEESILL